MTKEELTKNLMPLVDATAIPKVLTWMDLYMLPLFEELAAKNAEIARQKNQIRIRDKEIEDLRGMVIGLQAANKRLREGVENIRRNPEKYFIETYPLPEHPDRMQLEPNWKAFEALLSGSPEPDQRDGEIQRLVDGIAKIYGMVGCVSNNDLCAAIEIVQGGGSPADGGGKETTCQNCLGTGKEIGVYGNSECGVCTVDAAPKVDENGLLPCPFCGKSPRFKQSPKMNYWYVSCRVPYCIGEVHEDRSCPEETKAMAVTRWNTRASQPREGEKI